LEGRIGGETDRFTMNFEEENIMARDDICCTSHWLAGFFTRKSYECEEEGLKNET